MKKIKFKMTDEEMLKRRKGGESTQSLAEKKRGKLRHDAKKAHRP